MKSRFLAVSILCLCVLFLSAFTVYGQTPTDPENVAGVGVSFNQYATPQIAGGVFYAHKVAEQIYSITYVDVISKTLKPFTVNPVFTTGLSHTVLTVGTVRVSGVGSIGVSAGSDNVGYAVTAGGFAYVPLGKTNFSIIPNVRIVKGSINDFQAIYGLSFGWGK